MPASQSVKAEGVWGLASQPASSSWLLCLSITIGALMGKEITSTHLSSRFCLKMQLEKKRS